MVARLRVLPNKVTKTWPPHWTRTDLFLAVDAARYKMQWSSVFWLQNGDTSEALFWGSLFGFVNGSAKSHRKITKPVPISFITSFLRFIPGFKKLRPSTIFDVR